MKKIGKDTFNERLKQTMFENVKVEDIKPRDSVKTTKVNPIMKAKTIAKNYYAKWTRPRKMRSSEKVVFAILLTYAIYMIQVAQNF